MSMLTNGRSLRAGALIAVAAFTLLVPASDAQTPVGEATPVGDAASHPAHIHSGSCDALGDVVHPLTNVAAQSGEQVGATTAHEIRTSRTMVDASLDEILEGEHAINVHESDEAIDVYIACGDIGGVLVEEGGRRHLVIALGELNDSGHVGTAWLGEDGDQTEVVVNVIEPEEMQ